MVGLRDFKNLDLQMDAILVGAAVTGFYLWYRSYDSKQRVVMPNPISLPVDDNPTHRKSIFHSDIKILKSVKPEIQTITDLFQEGLTINPNGDVFGTRAMEGGPYRWIKWSDANTSIQNFRKGLITIGLEAGQDSMLGIFAKNSPQWHMTMQAAVSNSNVVVPLYLTLGNHAMTHILEETEMSIVVCENSSVLRLLDFVSDTSSVKTIISIGPITDAQAKEKIKSLGLKVYLWDEVCAIGSSATDVKATVPQPDDTAIICYTSGTTGKPKGAMLSHANIVSCMKAVWRGLWKFQSQFNKDESIISYLPAAHVYGFVSECIVLFVGGRVGYFRGDVKYLMEDIIELKPTVVPAVPRVLNKIYDKVNAQLDAKPAIVKSAFNYAVGCKVAEVEQGIVRKDSIWDTLFFKKIQDKLGGRVKVMMSGSAPIQPHVIQWFRAVLGTTIVEGYGQTETSAATSAYLMGDTVPGHVGVPPPEWEIKLCDVPEMNYLASNNVGEIVVKGPGVFKGYYKQPDQTAEVLKDGWLYSGDIGTWTPEGRLRIIDRKKNIFKLAQGEYIAPEKIECIYEQCPFVSQVYVYGESIKSTLIAIVILENQYVTENKPAQFKDKSVEDLSRDSEFNAFLLEQLGKTVAGDLFGFEQVKRIVIYPEEKAFTIDNDMLTPSFKKKRHNIKINYKKVLDELYKGLP